MRIEQYKSNRFSVCLDNRDYKASIELSKPYLVIDDDAKENSLIRVVDKSSKDYAFSEERFCLPNFRSD
jgi:hypothetical protein